MIDRQIILVLSGSCFTLACGPSDKYLSADSDKDGYSVALDCDDNNPDVHPNAIEVCNGIDDNCDTFIDDADPQLVTENVWYKDSDGDGYGLEGTEQYSCQPIDGFVGNKEDCNDAQPTANPDGVEFCNGVDDNCDGDIDDAPQDGLLWYLDADGDGYGVPDETIVACEQPVAYADNSLDCNDFDSTIFPEAVEVCDLIDNNCSGYIDAEDPAIDISSGVWYYPDEDGDGFGGTASGSWGCEVPSGYANNNSDCDDEDFNINPNAVEICDGIDNDCEPLSTENGMISQQTLNGWVDVSAVFSTGSVTPFAITQPTELLICPGQYDLAFSVESELTMNTTFDGVILSSAHHRVFAVSQNSTLDIEGITVDDSKGAIGCEQGNVLVSDGRFYGMYDPIQPLFAFDGCNVTFDVVEIEDNIVSTFNPILEATMSAVSFNQVEVTDNINGQNSTGIFFNQSSLSMIDSTITGQQGGTHRGVLLSDSDLECISTGSGQAGIYDTVVGGADSQSVALLGTSTFSSMGCDFGSMVAAGDDVNAKIIAGSKAYGPIQSQDIVCDSTGCSGTLDVQSVNATFMTSPTRFGFTGNVYHVTGNPTLLSIEIPIDASGSCGTELAIWTRSYSSSPWTLRWSEAKNHWFGTSMSFSPSGLMLKDGEEVAIGYGWACDPNVAMSVFETGNGLTGHLEFPGLRLSASGYTGQSLNNITLIENSQLRQLSHTVELWTP